MSRINTNVGSLIAQRVLGQQNRSLQSSLEKLSTGLKINRGADNPAGLIASEKLRSEKVSIGAAISNAERADQVSNIAEGGLEEVNNLLLQVQGLVGESANKAGLSREEREANQLQIDSILQTIDRIASTTSFEGVKLLNGTFDFTVSSQATTVSDFQINAAKLNFGQNQKVQVIVTASAQHGVLYLSVGGPLDLSAATANFSFDLAGSKGSRQFTYASGTALSAIAASVNTFKDVTGVSAKSSATGLVLKSTDFGTDHFVSFKLINRSSQVGTVFNVSSINENVSKTASGTAFTALTNAVRDIGQDVGAIINGIAATSRGKVARINTDFLDLSLELTNGGAQALATINAFTITSGGAKFNLGPSVDILNQVSLGIQNVAARNLGTVTTGYLSTLASGKANNVVDGDLATSQKVVNSAIDKVSSLRGRLGAFQQNVVGATIRSLGVALENTSAVESAIRDTDFASQTAQLTRSQILVSAATSVLSTANAQPQNVLRLLGQ